LLGRHLKEGYLSDLGKEIILLVGQNLFFRGRVEALAEPLGYEAQRATTESAFWDTHGSHQVALIVVDLEGDESIGAKSWRVSISRRWEGRK
jgi:hypothetical protein